MRDILSVAQHDGELDLDLCAHGPPPHLQQLLQDLRQGECACLEHARERHQPLAVAPEPVVDHVVAGHVHRPHRRQGAVTLGRGQVQQRQVEVVARAGILPGPADVDGEELALALAQPVVERAELGQRQRPRRAEAQRLAPAHHRAPEPQRHRRDAVLGLEVARRVVVRRQADAREVRIVVVLVPPADDLLHDDRHLLLLDAVGGRLDVALGRARVGRGVDQLDGVAQLVQAHLQVGMVVGQHVGGVDAREGLELAVLQQAARANRQRVAHLVQERLEVAVDLRRQLVRQAGLDHLGIVQVGQHLLAQRPLVQERVEHVRADDGGGRHADDGAREPVVQPVAVQQRVDEGQPAPLAAERTAADAHERAERVEVAAREVGHHPALALGAEARDGLHQELAQLLDVAELGHLARPDRRGQLELGARAQPVREVVVRGVVLHRLARDRAQQPDHGLEVGRAPHLGAVRQAEHELAETEVVQHEAPQVLQQRARALLDEAGPHAVRHRRQVGVRRLQHRRRVRVHVLDAADELQPGVLARRALPREAPVGDHAQQRVLVAGVETPGFLEGAGQQDLRPRAQPQQPVAQVDALGHQRLGLLEDLAVEQRQVRRIEADRVLDQQDAPHVAVARVVRHVALVLAVLDDGQQQPHVAVPQEGAVDAALAVGVLQVLQLARAEGQRVDGHVGHPAADAPGQLGRRHVPQPRHGHHHVVAVGLQQLDGLVAAAGARHVRRIGEVQLAVLVQQQLGEPPALFQGVGVVLRRDQEDLLDPERHQVAEPPELRGRVTLGTGRYVWHGRQAIACRCPVPPFSGPSPRPETLFPATTAPGPLTRGPGVSPGPTVSSRPCTGPGRFSRLAG